jgi:lipid A 4'-phosphatase
MTDPAYQRLLIAYLLTVILAQAAFATFPQIDLAVSGLFADGQAGFAWADGSAATINLVIRRVAETVALVLVLGCLIGGLTGRLRHHDLRAWSYVAVCVVLACGGIVNLVLKRFIGRARPDSLSEFGGGASFTPPWQMVEECARNCSFTSGEVALAAGLALPMLVLLWPRLRSRRARIIGVLVAAFYIATVSLFRIGLGRHYFSDALFSTLFAGAVAFVLYPVLRIAEARERFNPVDPFLPIGRGLTSLRQRMFGRRRRPA